MLETWLSRLAEGHRVVRIAMHPAYRCTVVSVPTVSETT